jgi:pheromone a factor receptor
MPCLIFFSKVLTIYVFYTKRSGLNEILLSNGNISTSGYLRLLIIAVIGSACLVPLGIFAIVISWKGILPWPGWSATHADMSYVEQVPATIWRSNRMLEYIMEITRWEFVFSASLFFACFGLHGEARASYQSTVQCLVTYIKCLFDPKYFVSLSGHP